eukprot:CAMPEP_0119029292 /NCGR_PEP_ID=MMETSP1176-20130426/40436_1 /TAXON_ID=265551 /ORGANISM="Synedropsis recta cf, Strain CCMP1620" /LENGTH=177 /DNA_ID=CAMNT_0006985623 /DNA_START=60 /DNA_END=594 /DNA_ORIENTATION=-
MASKEKPAEQPMASCRSSFTSFVRDLLLGMIIAAFVLVYGTFGMSKHHHQHGGAASNEDDYHYVASLSSSTHIKPAFRSLLKFVGDGCLGLAVATSVLAYGAFSKLVGSMTVVVNGTATPVYHHQKDPRHKKSEEHLRIIKRQPNINTPWGDPTRACLANAPDDSLNMSCRAPNPFA